MHQDAVSGSTCSGQAKVADSVHSSTHGLRFEPNSIVVPPFHQHREVGCKLKDVRCLAGLGVCEQGLHLRVGCFEANRCAWQGRKARAIKFAI